MGDNQKSTINTQAIQEYFQKQIEPFLKEVGEVAVRLQQWAASVDWVDALKAIKYVVEQLPEDVADLSVSLSNRGWYIWFSDAGISEIDAILKMNETEQDCHLKHYFESQAITIKQELLSCYPERSVVINDAFSAHDAQLYGASVPTLLALAEGICKDHFPDIGLYAKHPNDPKRSHKPGAPKTDDLFDKISPLDIFDEAVLKSLRITTNLTKSVYKPTAGEHLMFNRHLIMHGVSKGYGYKENSLKAIGLVLFVHKSLSHFKII